MRLMVNLYSFLLEVYICICYNNTYERYNQLNCEKGVIMYLSWLNSEEKNLFLQATLYLSNIDGDFAETEKAVIEQMCKEMEIPVDYQLKMSGEEIIDGLSNVNSLVHKKIFLLEFTGVVIADGIYADSERNLIYKFADAFSLQHELADNMSSLIFELTDLYKKIRNIVQE